MAELRDVVVEVAAGVVVCRKGGVWQWRAEGKTKADVMREIAFQMTRTGIMHEVLGEALEGLRSSP